MPDRATVAINQDTDVVEARLACRDVAETAGFRGSDLVCIATAVSEVARNILSYAGSGTITCRALSDLMRPGIEVVATDQGPGIPNLDRAMQHGFSTGNSLGLGLPGARRLMDKFEIHTSRRGTKITMRKYVR